jgi:hypothetical protein
MTQTELPQGERMGRELSDAIFFHEGVAFHLGMKVTPLVFSTGLDARRMV